MAKSETGADQADRDAGLANDSFGMSSRSGLGQPKQHELTESCKRPG
jgi:hypothetical protein